MRPVFSVCIPAYNRAQVLPELLDSILNQDFDSYELLINEDASPQRHAIRAVVEEYSVRYTGRIRYFENKKNLGYDANLRSLVERSRGKYCLFMGNDDLMCPGALSTVAEAINRFPNVGVVVRSYSSFDGTPRNINQTFKYFSEERFFPAGADTIATVYRRSVVISGMVIHRDTAHQFATTAVDGTLLYQIYLVANILVDMNAVFLPQIIVLYRNGGVPDFGNAEAEIGKFVPKERTIASSLVFMQGMLNIAASIEQKRNVAIYRRIISDIANYSYPVLSIQANKPLSEFIGYWWGLVNIGFGRYILFHAYFLALVVLGAPRVDRLIAAIKRRIGYTPNLGNLFKGHSL